eukprot:6485189-Amphidinium_carterae.1
MPRIRDRRATTLLDTPLTPENNCQSSELHHYLGHSVYIMAEKIMRNEVFFKLASGATPSNTNLDRYLVQQWHLCGSLWVRILSLGTRISALSQRALRQQAPTATHQGTEGKCVARVNQTGGSIREKAMPPMVPTDSLLAASGLHRLLYDHWI